jgi:carbonic anhydrase
MKKTSLRFTLSTITALMVAITLAGCRSATTSQTSDSSTSSLQEQSALSPLDTLKSGNQRYVAGHPTHEHQDIDRRTEVSQGQHPIAIIVGCSDSRVPPEIVFDQGLGDLFVVRVAGNVVDDHAIGSIEYAAEHLHAPLIVVLGHDRCGAVQAAVSSPSAPGHIQSIVDAIRPAVEAAKSEPGDLLDNAIDENVRRVVAQLQTSEPILHHEIEAGHLQVVGARYELNTGVVRFFPAQ